MVDQRGNFLKCFATQTGVRRKQSKRKFWVVDFAKYFIVGAVHMCLAPSNRNDSIDYFRELALLAPQSFKIAAATGFEITPGFGEVNGSY